VTGFFTGKRNLLASARSKWKEGQIGVFTGDGVWLLVVEGRPWAAFKPGTKKIPQTFQAKYLVLRWGGNPKTYEVRVCHAKLSFVEPTSRLDAHQLRRCYWRGRENCHPAVPTIDKRRPGQWSLRFLLAKAGHSTDVSHVIYRSIRHQQRHCVRFLFQYYYWLFKFPQVLFWIQWKLVDNR
jgi:hypothetical protein